MLSFQEALVPEAEGWAEDCRSGRMSAYERLFQAHGTRMKSIALNMLGNVPDAEDAVQEAFVKIYRGVGGFKGEAAFTTWIYRVLVNACYDLMRARRRRGYEARDAQPGSELAATAAAGSTDHPLRLTLEQSLTKLSRRTRTVFLLFEVEGFRHREIAEILGISEGTSRSILFEAKRELQRLILAGRTEKD